MERPALPAATHDERGAVSACISRALSSLCGLRAHFTFLPCEAKTFHFCAAVYVRLPLTYIRAKISRPQPPNIVCAYFGCSAAQDIKGWSTPRSGCSGCRRSAASSGARPVSAPMERFYALTIIKKRGRDLSIGAVTGTCLSAIVRNRQSRERIAYSQSRAADVAALRRHAVHAR